MEKKPQPTRPDVLARIAAMIERGAVKSEAAFCRLAGLRPMFCSDARQGRGRGARAAITWQRAEATLGALEGTQPADKAKGGDDKREKAIADFKARVDAADTPAKDELLQAEVIKGIADGLWDPNVGGKLTAAIAEKRLLNQQKLDREMLARAGEPVRVTIRYIDSWRAEHPSSSSGVSSGQQG